MLSASTIITVCWLLFLGYWSINWWKVKPAKETVWKSSSGKWTILWIVVLLSQEEKLLKKHFPKEYPTYMKKTKTLIPFIY